MLGSFMDDIGITADQFEAACHLSAHDLAELPAYFHKRLFEQIWAANDYDMFVKMMTHKNVELQLQVRCSFKYVIYHTVVLFRGWFNRSVVRACLSLVDIFISMKVMSEIKKLAAHL